MLSDTSRVHRCCGAVIRCCAALLWDWVLPSFHRALSRFLFRNAFEADQPVQREVPSAVTATLSELGAHILEPSSGNRVVIIHC